MTMVTSLTVCFILLYISMGVIETPAKFHLLFYTFKFPFLRCLHLAVLKEISAIFGWKFTKLVTIGNASLQYLLLSWVWQVCTRERSCSELTDRLISPTTSSRSSTPDPTTWCTTSTNQLARVQQTNTHHPNTSSHVPHVDLLTLNGTDTCFQ